MKYLRCVFIFISLCFFSCEKEIQFIKNEGTEDILYTNGDIQGVVFQKKEWREKGEKHYGKLIFDKSNQKILKNYLEQIEAFITAWLKKDKSNDLVNEWYNKNEKNENTIWLVDPDKFIASLGRQVVGDSEEIYKLDIEALGNYFLNAGRSNINKLKRMIEFEMESTKSGGVLVYLFYSSGDKNWIDKYPPTSSNMTTRVYMFFMEIKSSLLSNLRVFVDPIP